MAVIATFAAAAVLHASFSAVSPIALLEFELSLRTCNANIDSDVVRRFIISAKSTKLAAVTGFDTGISVLIRLRRGLSPESRLSPSIRSFTFAAAPEVTIGASAQVTSIITTVPLSTVVPNIRDPSGNIML